MVIRMSNRPSWRNQLLGGILGGLSGKSLQSGKIARDLQAREDARSGREARQDQAAYGNGSRSGNYGSSTYSFKSGKFSGLPSLYRTRQDGATEHFYQAGSVDLNDRNHGHVVIKDDRIVYHRRPNESTPIINRQ
jgi:hypothetical protein